MFGRCGGTSGERGERESANFLKFGELRIVIGERAIELVAIARIAARLQIFFNTLAGKKQNLFAAVRFGVFRRRRRLLRAAGFQF